MTKLNVSISVDYDLNRKAYAVWLHEKCSPAPATFWYEAEPVFSDAPQADDGPHFPDASSRIARRATSPVKVRHITPDEVDQALEDKLHQKMRPGV